MQLTISGHHLDITEALNNHITNKISRLERHHDRITSTNVILTVDNLDQKAEATVHVSGAEFFADAVDADMYHAIDQLVDKLDRQLIKHKEKHRAR